MLDCEFQECDCDECCPSLENARGFQGQNGPNALDIVGPQGFVGPEYVAPQGPRGPQGPLCCTTESLRGPQGDQGPQGQNQDGFQGSMGSQGATTPSLEGAQGLLGMQGAQGRSDVGMQGFQGSSQQGAQGPQGYQGFLGPSSIGVMGAQGMIVSLSSSLSNPVIRISSSGSIVQLFPPPGPGKFLCTICFSIVIDEATVAFPELVTFQVHHLSVLLATIVYEVSSGDVNHLPSTLLVFDVFTRDDLTTAQLLVLTLSASTAHAYIVYNFAATFRQIS